jgi:tripartite-type tricarboxylate transporter receptor subunit TctC
MRRGGMNLMTFPRREFLRLVAGAAAVPPMARFARAQMYPLRPVKIVVGFPPGGAQDVHARLIGEWLTGQLSQPFMVENRPGGGTNIATASVVRAPADGYTLLLVVAANTVNATLYEKLDFDFGRDIAPIASISRVPLVVVVHPAVPANTIAELIADAKANPGKIKMGSTGNGGTPHLAGELFKMLAAVDMPHMPFRGADGAQSGMVEGRTQVMFSLLPEAIDNIRARRLRALAVTTVGRVEALPDLPTVGDFLPGYEASTWNGIGAPRDTPIEVIDLLSEVINVGLADPGIKARLAEQGSAALPGSPADFSRFIASETEKWGKVVKFAGLKAG